jgi:hypothetical protein
VELRQAQEALSRAEALFKAGALAQPEYQAKKDSVELLKAQIAGDPAEIARVRLVAAQRQLELAEALFKEGAMAGPDYQAAKNAVELRQAELRAAEAAQSATPAFGPVIERVVYDPDASCRDCFIDLDTGNLVSIPDDPDLKARIRTGLQTAVDKEVRSWAAGKGVDATAKVVIANGKAIQCGLNAVHVMTSKVANEAGDKWTPAQVRDHPNLSLSVWRFIPATAELNTDGKFPATWIFRTDEGGMGILQITGFTENPRGVTIRYKLVQAVTALPAPAPTSAKQGEGKTHQNPE